MTPPASLNRVEVLSGLAGTIGDNLSDTSGNAVDLSSVAVSLLPVGEVDGAAPETVYLGEITGAGALAPSLGNRHLVDTWSLTVTVLCQPDGGAAAETALVAAMTRCQAVVSIVAASVHGASAGADQKAHVSNIDGPQAVGGAPTVVVATVTVTVNQNLHPAVPTS